MIIFNDALLTKRIGEHNVQTFKQVLMLSTVNNDKIVKQKVLAVVQQFEIETELLKHHGE